MGHSASDYDMTVPNFYGCVIGVPTPYHIENAVLGYALTYAVQQLLRRMTEALGFPFQVI